MDEEINPDPGEDVTSVLAEETAELLHILSRQSPAVITKLLNMIPGGVMLPDQLTSSDPQRVEAMVEYFRWASAAECSTFLQSVCMLCDDIPVHLECRLMSAAGQGSSSRESSSTAVDHKSLSPPSDLGFIKRPKIDHWEVYIATVKRSLLRRWERLTQHLLRDVELESVWVSPRTANRGRDRPDQTPGSADRGGRTPEPDGDFVCLESKVTLDSFLQEITGKITVLTGRAGSGKTLLMSLLGQQWASSLGPLPSSYLFVLLEFRQLNHLPCPLSLSELLFQHYLPPEGGDMAKRTIVDYLLSNPEQSCWVLDGYDEFRSKLSRTELQRGPLDLENSLPVADLISGLLNRQLLPGSTVLVTCRLRDVVDLDGVSDKVGQLLGWNHQEIQEYLNNFFHAKGHSDGALKEKAADILFSNRHLLAMSSLPALCNICCICLDYLLLGERTQTTQNLKRRETEERTDRGAQIPPGHAPTKEKDGHAERNKDIQSDGTNGRDELLQTAGQVPGTLTQVYLTLLSAFLSRDSLEGEQPNPTRFPQSFLSPHQSKLCELSKLAWKGLEEHTILFLEEEVSRDVLEFSIRTGLFKEVEFRLQGGMSVKAFSFIHLTVQEFFAALRVMTSNDVSDAQLKKRFNLKTRWTTKSDQRTVFTDSLCLYVCGLASPNCTSALVQLSIASGEAGFQNCVQKRQTLVLNLLKTLCNSTLTGPKVLELCHCVQETQDQQLAKQFVDSRPTLELRNIWLLPNDIDALAFVVNSGGDNGFALDFGACSMELECLDVLPRCKNFHQLSFRSRKYGDKFAEKLSSILPELKTLKKLEFCGGSVTAAGAAHLASGLQSCPHITEINLSGNNLKNEGLEQVAEIFTHLQSLQSVVLGRNNTTLEGMHCLVEKMSLCQNIQHVHADGMKEIKVTFSKNSDWSHRTKHAQSISLLNQKWRENDMLRLVTLLACCPALSVVDLSGGQWDEDILETLTENLSKINVTGELILNETCTSVKSLFLLTALLSACPSVIELRIRLQKPVQVSIVFKEETEKPAKHRPKVLCISSCNLRPANLEGLWKSLGRSSGLNVLDVSNNSLGSHGLKMLLDVLPRLNKIQEIIASNNGISVEGVAMLAAALCSHDKFTQAHISDGGNDQVILKLCSGQRAHQSQLKTFRINSSVLSPADVTKICRKMIQCQSPLELEFIHSSLSNGAIKSLVKVLPKMTALQKLNVSQSIASTADALALIGCLTNNQRVATVELSTQDESFISLARVKAEEASCRLTDFSLNCDNLERLFDTLQKGPRLSFLDLSSNQLGDEGVKALVDSVPKLKISHYVNLNNNRLTQQGLLQAARTLLACSNVSGLEVSLGVDERCLVWFSQTGSCGKTLSVRESSLEREHVVRLAEIISNCPTVNKLELKNNSLQLEWIEELMEMWKTRQTEFTFSIAERWIRAEKAVHLLCRCLELNGNIQSIRIQQSTLEVSLESTELSSVCGESEDPTQMMATRKISLVDCVVDDNDQASMWKIMQSCRFLTELNFSHSSLSERGTEFLCSFLPLLTNLTRLSLSGHVISDAAAQSLTGLIPRLRSLNLSHCVWSVVGGLQLIEALGRCPGLEDLCLDSVQLNSEGQMCLSRTLRCISSIRSLKLNKTATGGNSESITGLDLLDAMEGLTQMKEIELDGWRISDTGTQQLIRLLPHWKELRKIILSENVISDPSGEKLIGAVKSCRHLQELHLAKNRLGDVSAARMAVVLPALTRLSVLDISENHIGSNGVARLSKAIMCMKNLSKINLTAVGTSELCAVAASLAHCPLIHKVSLGWNNCDDTVALELAKVLHVCHKLSWIDLESNHVTLSGAAGLIRALKSCPALQVIRLWKNKISQSEAQMLSLKDRRLNFSST